MPKNCEKCKNIVRNESGKRKDEPKENLIDGKIYLYCSETRWLIDAELAKQTAVCMED